MEDVPTMVLCKPKLLPLKSVTLEKLEKMHMEAQEAVKQQELAMKEQPQ
ncbi:putative BBSome-interacting protein 1-like isoform 2 [Scophthalmus maximus]|nr:putative BBSome-interacting protein 1-like isoform 2 [Scophthalmus maximus]